MKTITLCWLKPEGPVDYYRFYRDGDLIDEVVETQRSFTDEPHSHTYRVTAMWQGLESPPCQLFLAYRITDIQPVTVENPEAGTTITGIIVTFATVPGRRYWLDKSTDGQTWTEVATTVAVTEETKIGGDVREPAASYRVREQL